MKGNVELKGPRQRRRAREHHRAGHAGRSVSSATCSFEISSKPIRYEDGGKLQTEVRVERCPGQLRIGRGYVNGDNLIGPVVINARSKDVQINDFTNSIEVQLDRGDVELRPGKVPVPKMDVNTRAGHIDLALPEGAKFAAQGNCEQRRSNERFRLAAAR